MEIPFLLSSNDWKKNNKFFISGISTEVGKTFTSKILCHYFQYDYWKPIQTGTEDVPSDTEVVHKFTDRGVKYKETYSYPQPISPHLAATLHKENINLDKILHEYHRISQKSQKLIIEGAGGVLSPINDKEFFIDLILKLKLPTVLVSKNYLGSLNHTLLTVEVLKHNKIPIIGMILNGGYPEKYKNDLVEWTGLNVIMEIPLMI